MVGSGEVGFNIVLLGSSWSSCSRLMATMRRRQLRADEFAASALVHQAHLRPVYVYIALLKRSREVPWHTTLRLVHWIGSKEAWFRVFDVLLKLETQVRSNLVTLNTAMNSCRQLWARAWSLLKPGLEPSCSTYGAVRALDLEIS